MKMGKLMDLVPGDVREDISREKMAGPLLNRGGPPFLSYQGESSNDSVHASTVRG